MSDTSEQNFSNHTKLVPLYHYIGTPIVLAVVIWSIVRGFRHPSADTALIALMAVAMVVQHALLRTFPLKVQDRLIRLEERLRLQSLLSEPLRSRINEFTEHQLVAMRFASDDEIPTLAQTVLDRKLTSRKEVKKQIKHWRPDTFRV